MSKSRAVRNSLANDRFACIVAAFLLSAPFFLSECAPSSQLAEEKSAREIPGLDFPNVRSASLQEIWFQSPVFQRFRGTDWMPEPCRSCDRRELDFGGCRCQAMLLIGDPSATDPVCQLSPLHHVVEQFSPLHHVVEQLLVEFHEPAALKFRSYAS